MECFEGPVVIKFGPQRVETVQGGLAFKSVDEKVREEYKAAGRSELMGKMQAWYKKHVLPSSSAETKDPKVAVKNWWKSARKVRQVVASSEAPTTMIMLFWGRPWRLVLNSGEVFEKN
eukprot:COSAG04_NODE_345_length_16159_cov_5.383126_3_plen_118_part_00